jgi:hypothetical protein
MKPHLVHTDNDKPHRCPACWRVAVYDKPQLPWRVYTCCGCQDRSCGCGQRFAARPWLPYYPQDRGHLVRCLAQSCRETGWMFWFRWRNWGLRVALADVWRSCLRTMQAIMTRNKT